MSQTTSACLWPILTLIAAYGLLTAFHEVKFMELPSLGNGFHEVPLRKYVEDPSPHNIVGTTSQTTFSGRSNVPDDTDVGQMEQNDDGQERQNVPNNNEEPVHSNSIDQTNQVVPEDTQEADATPSQNGSKVQKPRFVLHIGPLKTATTTVQNDLGRLDFKHYLEDDNWHYATSPTTFRDGTEIKRAMIDLFAYDDNFFVELKESLDELLPFGRNVIHSKEGLSVDFSKFDGVYEKLHNTLADDWDVTIVAGYRPYYDWAVSLWSQSQKRNPVTETPHKWFWQKDDGTFNHVSPFENSYKFWISNLEWFTNWIVQRAEEYFPVEIYNMNDVRGPSAAFVCDILKAQSSCEVLKEEAKEHTGGAHKNVGSLDAIYYDAVSQEAVQREIVDYNKHTRYEMQQAIQGFMEEREESPRQDWPMVCPDREPLDQLLNRTLVYEAECMPEMLTEEREREIREDFESKMDDNVFCAVNLESLLDEHQELVEFLQLYS